MSKKCPHCGSYNTKVSIENYVKQGMLQVCRFTLAAGAAAAAGIINPKAGHMAGHAVIHNTKLKKLEGYHCNNCGKDFNA